MTGWNVALAAALVCGAAAAYASSPHHVYTMPWPDRKQQLTYRSCGCADSCWVAELRERRTKRLQARLRCDCEQLLFARGPGMKETVVAPSCDTFNLSDDKTGAIAADIKARLDTDSGR